jgi:alpha-L-fucosidase
MAADSRLQWFRDARFGVFLHWGLYSVLGRNEWSLYLDRWRLRDYEKLADRFEPSRYNADQWAAWAAESGVRYMVLTTRHHDGFCLFDSRVSDFTSVRRAAKRDLVAEYTEALRNAGIKVGLYYSLVDWRFKGAWQADRYPDSAAAMVERAHAQVRELMTNYGPIDLLWYDGGTWSGSQPPAEAYRSRALNAMVRELQPQIIINDRSGLPEDFGTPECRIEASADEQRPWESCLQMDDISWGHVPHSPDLKTAERIVADLVEVAAGAGNLLLNTGPQPDGRIRPEEERRIRTAGTWLRRNGAAIYGSRRSPLQAYGAMGSANRMSRWIGSPDPCVHYLAALCWTGAEFFTVQVDGAVKDVTILATGEKVSHARGHGGRLTFTGLPDTPPDPLCTVFRVVFERPPRHMEPCNDGSWLDSPTRNGSPHERPPSPETA